VTGTGNGNGTSVGLAGLVRCTVRNSAIWCKNSASTRFNSSLPLALNELAILVVARWWNCQFVWWALRRIAAEAQLDDATLIKAMATGESPPVLAVL
jgi:hypothetical protein